MSDTHVSPPGETETRTFGRCAHVRVHGSDRSRHLCTVKHTRRTNLTSETHTHDPDLYHTRVFPRVVFFSVYTFMVKTYLYNNNNNEPQRRTGPILPPTQTLRPRPISLLSTHSRVSSARIPTQTAVRTCRRNFDPSSFVLFFSRGEGCQIVGYFSKGPGRHHCFAGYSPPLSVRSSFRLVPVSVVEVNDYYAKV